MLARIKAFELPPSALLLLTLLAGALGALSQEPFALAPCMLLMLAAGCLIWQRSATVARAFLSGWALGVGYFILSLRWILEPFQIDAAAHAWMAPFALALLAAGLALFWGAAFALARWIGRSMALILCWTLAELARAYVFTGFPWANPAQGMLDTGLAPILAYIGPYGVMLNLCLIASLVMQAQRILWAGVALAAVLLAIPSPPPTPQMTPHVIRIVQPNAPQDQKWSRDLAHTFVDTQLAYTGAPSNGPRPALVIWPETAIPYLSSVAQPIFEYAAEAAQGAPVLMGAQRDDAEGNYYNAALLIGPDAAIAQTYDKHHLVPFGEYMPFPALFRNLGISALAERADQGYAAGPGPALMDLGDLGKALILICYEAVFPQDTRTPERPALMIQVTNDAWFGLSLGPQQHLALARMRAIEQGLPLARSANTGISAMIGPRGALLNQLPLNQAGFVDAPLPAPLPRTFYSRSGDLPLALLLLGGLCWSLYRRRRH